MRTIPVTEIVPDQIVDTANAVPSGPVIRVRAVATVGGLTYVLRRESGALVPESFRFRADQRADVYA